MASVEATENWLARWREFIEWYTSMQVGAKDRAIPLHPALRRGRDIRLHILTTAPDRPPRRILGYLRNALQEHDEAVDNLLSGSPTGELTNIEAEGLQLLQDQALSHVTAIEQSYRRWRRWATAATVAGLLAVVIGQAAWVAGMSTAKPLVAWGWLGLTLIGIGLISAIVFTRTAVGDLPERWRLALIALPALIVLVAVLLALLGGQPRPAYIATGVVATLVVVAMVAVAVVTSDPQRVLDDFSSLVPLPPAGDGVGPSRIGRLGAELRQVEMVVEDRARQERRSARGWQVAHIVVGGAAALASGAAGVVLTTEAQLSGSLRTVITVLAVGGAGLTALATTLNPGRRAENAGLTSAGCEALVREIGVMTRLDLRGYGRRGGREALEDVLDRYDALVGVTGPDSFWSRHHKREEDVSGEAS